MFRLFKNLSGRGRASILLGFPVGRFFLKDRKCGNSRGRLFYNYSRKTAASGWDNNYTARGDKPRH